MKKLNVVHNIFALGFVQLLGYLIPLVTLPYLTRVLGVESWGNVVYANTIINYFGLLTNWGFGISATCKIASSRDNQEKISQIFFATWAAQWVLSIIVIIILLLLVCFFNSFEDNYLLYIYGIGIIINTVLCPMWFLNGLEKMKQVAVIQIITRVTTVPLIFIFIHNANDAPLVIAITAITGLCGGVLTMIWIKWKLGLIWCWPTWRQTVNELKEGGDIFLSTIWISLYSNVIPIILGSISGAVVVGYFSLAERVKIVGQTVFSPIIQALFPRMNYLFSTNVSRALYLLKRSSLVICIISGVSSTIIFLFSKEIVLLLASKQFEFAIPVLKLMAPLPFIISFSNIIGLHIMLPNNKRKAYNLILGIAGFMSLILIVPLIKWKGAEGAAIDLLITESYIAIAMLLYLFFTGFFTVSNNWIINKGKHLLQ